MYFTPLFGPTLWRVETKYLHDPSLAREAPARVEAVVRIPPASIREQGPKRGRNRLAASGQPPAARSWG